MKHRVECGFRKWAISHDDDHGAITVEYNYHPIYGKVTLCDVSVEDLQNLGDMFTGLALIAKSQKAQKSI